MLHQGQQQTNCPVASNSRSSSSELYSLLPSLSLSPSPSPRQDKHLFLLSKLLLPMMMAAQQAWPCVMTTAAAVHGKRVLLAPPLLIPLQSLLQV